MKPDISTFVAPVSNRDNFEHEALGVPMEMSERVYLFHISFRVQTVDPGHNPAIRLLFELQLLWTGKPRGLTAGLSALSLRWFLGSGWSATRATLFLGSLGYHRQLQLGLLITASPGRVRFKGWMMWIRLRDGFLDTHIRPTDPDCTLLLLPSPSRQPFLESTSSRGRDWLCLFWLVARGGS